jgi:succinyl-CoA synthetase alpha subunit
MLGYGTKVVAGVSPGHGGERLESVPVFDSCAEATSETGAEFSVCFVGGAHVLDAVCEAVDAGIHSIVCIEEFVPIKDIVRAKRYCAASSCRLIGPNCNGILSPGKAKVGFFPDELSLPGPVGIASRSGSLTYGAMLELHALGLGQSTVVGIGGASVKGTSFVDCLELFADDDQTEVVVLLGEIGGEDEEAAARHVQRQGYPKPVAALVVGRVAPPGVHMGHAGAIVAADQGGYDAKVLALQEAGVTVAPELETLAAKVRDELDRSVA